MQTQFDFTRAEQLGTLDRCVLPPRPGVSSSALKATLRAIDSHGRGKECWPSESTIASQSGLSVRTVKRCIKALNALSVICIERKGHLTLNHYRIVWNELALLIPAPKQAQNEVPRSANEVPPCPNEVPWCPNEVPPCHQRSAVVALETYKQTYKENQLTAGDANAGLVELVFLAGVKKAKNAIDCATQNGLNEVTIRERVQRWRELPESNRSPGVLYNWLALRGSFEAFEAPSKPVERPPVRGDSLSRSEVDRNRLRWRIVRAGRAAGATPEEIDRRCELAGV